MQADIKLSEISSWTIESLKVLCGLKLKHQLKPDSGAEIKEKKRTAKI